MMVKKKSIGMVWKTSPDIIAHENPVKIFNKACPLEMFANNRMLKLKTREKYETISISTISGANARGTPDGKKRLKYSNPLRQIAIKFIPKKYVNAK